MIKINVISLFPEIVRPVFEWGVVSRAVEKDLIGYEFVSPRQFAKDQHGSVDDRPFGGGDGMVMMVEPLKEAMESIEQPGKRIYLSPQGSVFSQEKAVQLASEDHITLVCGRYGGVDQRFLNAYIDEEISIGDYVLSGGELAAGVLVDALARQIPGVLGHQNSKDLDSFSEGLLEGPSFTQPSVVLGKEVPAILKSGHHENIRLWRENVSVLTTLQRRPELPVDEKKKQRALAWAAGLSSEEKTLLGLKE